jgi:hypothetical protein
MLELFAFGFVFWALWVAVGLLENIFCEVKKS